MEVTDAESSQSLENNFSEHPLSREYKTEDTEGREHEPVNEETDIEDPESDTEPPESISVGLSTEDGLCCEVTLNVNIALAIPNAEDDDSVTAVEKTKKKCKKSVPNTVIEAPKAQSYYHIEYNLLPHDPEPTKVDLVMFGLAAKLYKGNKSKVLKPWIEDDKTWLTWTQSVRLKVTKEMLIKLVHHKVTFRVWDTKDHMSSTAKHDRPKAFRLPADKNDEGGPDHFGTRNMILRLRDNFEKESLKMKQVGESMQYELRKTSDDMHCATAEPKSSNADVANERAASSTAVTQEPQYTTRSADQGRDQESPLDSRGTQDQLKDSKQFSQRAFPVQGNKRFNLRRTTIFKASLANSDYIRKHGAATAELSFIYLLAGEKSLTGSLLTRSKGVLEGMCNLTLDKPLISGEMKAMLNPLVITILSATRLPSTPVPFYKLEEYCLPVYCQYKFHNTKLHKTKGHEHSSHIYFKDVNVIFTGLISQGELIEYLHGSPLEIEVHDRDRKGDSPPKSPTIFGRSPQDDLLSNVALINSKGITHNPFKPVKPRHPHGVARLSFAELLNGHRSLRYSLDICSSAPPQILGKDQAQWESKMLEVAGARNDPQTDCMPMGHYLELNSQLNVQVEIACPINVDNIAATEEECPFGRIVHLMKHDNVGALSRLCAEILRVNAAAFQLKCKAEEAMQRALGCYKVTTQEMESRELDFLSGFHLLDKNMHLFVIEGLKDGAIRRLWEMSSTNSDEIDWRQITTLYNSALSFSKRLYDCLDLSFCPIHLHEPLEAIMRRPLVYVRDMVPHACFQGLSRISQLCQVSSMKDAVRNSLFPTGEMVLSLSKEFGCLPEKGQQILERICQSAQGAPETQRGRGRPNPPIENYNQEYVEWKELVATQQLCGGTKDFIQANIEEVQRASQRAQKPKPAVVVVAEVEEGKMAHNYSIQTLNSSAQAKELLRKEMAKAPRQRFTYSEEFQSATFEPCDVEAERKAAEGRSRRAWRTHNGFTYPGFQSSIEANEHPKMPDEARINELRKPWRENILHDNTLRPTLSRGTWPWERRSEDFELYVKPPPVFLPQPPVTIHLAGDLLKEEQLEAARAQYKRWLWKILPDKGNTESHRVPQFKFHLEKDRLDKHIPILNNQPKYALANTRTLRKTAPAVSAPEVASKERQRRVPCVPDGPESDGNQNQSQDHSVPYNNNNPFRGYWRPHSFQYKREVQPLTEEELEVYHFRRRTEAATPPRPAPLRARPAGNVSETRTHRAVVLHLH